MLPPRSMRSRSKSSEDTLTSSAAHSTVTAHNCCKSEQFLAVPGAVTALELQLRRHQGNNPLGSSPCSGSVASQISRISSRWERMESGEILDNGSPRDESPNNISRVGSLLNVPSNRLYSRNPTSCMCR
ncbi:unnamed protein product [Anisakis simplex]|uniref:Uncharacterized protein n=1 Tax=Anisakis simplex TaxID=6269 RepID=A0A0M3KA93_ANISI|nr:unnamed protein product [Anisakis simplex]